MSKDSEYSIKHCVQRLHERYNLIMNEEEYKILNKNIKQLVKTPVKYFKNDFGYIYDITTVDIILTTNFKDTCIFCNYDIQRDCLTTILPPITYLEHYKGCVCFGFNLETIVKKYGIEHENNLHVTVFNAKEAKTIKLENFTEKVNVYDIGLGKQTCASDSCIYVILIVPALTRLRQKYGLPPKDFHITLQVTGSDIHHLPKDVSTLFKLNNDIIQVIKNMLNNNDSEFIPELLVTKINDSETLIEIARKNPNLLESIGNRLLELGYLSGLYIYSRYLFKSNTNIQDIRQWCITNFNNLKTDNGKDLFGQKVLDILNHQAQVLETYKYSIENDIYKFSLHKFPHNFSHIHDNLYASGIPSESCIETLKFIGIEQIITLMEPHEMKQLASKTFSDNFKLVYFNIEDLKPPTIDQMLEICDIIPKYKTLVHCKGGRGRTGTVLICYLMKTLQISRQQTSEYLTGRITMLSIAQENFVKQDWFTLCNGSLKVKLPPLVMLVGFPASGKSTFAKALCELSENLVYVSQDEIRTKSGCENLVSESLRKNKIVILDRCNLTIEERKYWMDVSFKVRCWCVWFNTEFEECLYRIGKRQNHPTVKASSGATILNSLKNKLEEPTIKEGFEKVLIASDELINSWGVVLNIQNDLIKFPRTRHLVNLGAASSDDLLVTDTSNFLNKPIYIEEKIDGSNIGISLDEEGNIQVQNRSHFINSSYHEQFKYLDKWIYTHEDELRTFLDNNILYGEWVYMTHAIKYDALPDWFIAYDLYDKNKKKFVSRDVLEKTLENTNINIIKLLCHNTFKNTQEIVKYVGKQSNYSNNTQNEGVYIRTCENGYLLDRCKIVRGNFECGNKLWNKKMETNILKD